MPRQDSEIRVLTATHDLDDYDILSTNTCSVAVPYQTTEGLRKLIWAAMVTYVFGNSSVDHVLRRYGYLWDRRKERSFETNEQILRLRSTQEDIELIAAKLEKTNISDQLGHVCAKSALCRLEASFKAAYGLIRRHYIFETEAIVRLLLEQLAWAHEAYSSNEEAIRTLNPTKCITPFKAVFKEAGKFYGELSEGAHLDPSIVEHYLRFHSEGSKVIRRSPNDSQYIGYYLTALASVYLEVVQELFAPFSESEYQTIDARLRGRHRKYTRVLNGDGTDA